MLRLALMPLATGRKGAIARPSLHDLRTRDLCTMHGFEAFGADSLTLDERLVAIGGDPELAEPAPGPAARIDPSRAAHRASVDAPVSVPGPG